MTNQVNPTQLLLRLKDGDEDAAAALWHGFVERIQNLARQKLVGVPKRVGDEEDIAISAFHSFFQGAVHGRFEKLENRQDLWKILAVIICRKVNRQIEYLLAQKRGNGKTRGDSVFVENHTGHVAGLEAVADSQPAADAFVVIQEEFDLLLDQLPDHQLRQIALLKLDGFKNCEIAEQIGKNIRSVERKLNIIRGIWNGDIK